MTMTTAEKSARYRAKNVEAYREKKRELAKTPHHKLMRRDYMRKWRAKNRPKHNASARVSYERHKHKYVRSTRERHLFRKFGMTQADYEAMLLSQNGTCAICPSKAAAKKRAFHVDHDHVTGKVRGILCVRCNTALGSFERIGLSRIMEYLLRGAEGEGYGQV